MSFCPTFLNLVFFCRIIRTGSFYSGSHLYFLQEVFVLFQNFQLFLFTATPTLDDLISTIRRGVHFIWAKSWARSYFKLYAQLLRSGVDFINPYMLYAKLLRSAPSFYT